MDQHAAPSPGVTDRSPDFLSPGKSRYGRTRRPKITRDFCNIDDVVIDENPPPSPRQAPLRSPKLKPPPKPPIIHHELVFEDEFTKLDDLGMKVANNFKTNLQRGLDDSIKERKFFKSLPENKLDVPNVVDVTKVFKIISSKPVPEMCETKSPAKAALKTYSNKRKHLHDGDSFIVESFGLPDEPIVPVKNPFTIERDTKIDVDMSCETDCNLANPWTFEEFEPLYASEPFTSFDEMTFGRGSMYELFTDALWSENMEGFNITSNYQSGVDFEKSRIPTPEIAPPLTQSQAQPEKEDKIISCEETSSNRVLLNTVEPEKQENFNPVPEKNEVEVEAPKTKKAVKVLKKSPLKEAKIDNSPSRILRSSHDNNNEVKKDTTPNTNDTSTAINEPKIPVLPKRQIISKPDLKSPTTPKPEPKRPPKLDLKSPITPKREAKKLDINTPTSPQPEKVTPKSLTTPKPVRQSPKTNLKSPATPKPAKSQKSPATPKVTIKPDLKTPVTPKSEKSTPKSDLKSPVASKPDFKSPATPKSVFKSPATPKSNIKSPATSKSDFKSLTPPKPDLRRATPSKSNSKTVQKSDSKTPTPEPKKTPLQSPLKNQFKNQVINPVNFSKICSPQVRVILNPLACMHKLLGNKTLVPNPFQIRKHNFKKLNPKRGRKLHSDRLNGLTQAIVGNSLVKKVSEVKKKGKKKAVAKKAVEKMEVDVKVEEVDEKFVKMVEIEFQVGDLTWAKIGKNPYWPCMITQEPTTGEFKKTVSNRSLPLYHVRFFGDKGRRSWVTAQYVMLFYGRDDLDRLAKLYISENKLKMAYIRECCTIRAPKLLKWQQGVNEAESLKYKTVQQRLDYFFETFASKQEKEEKLKELGIKMEVFDAIVKTEPEEKSKKRTRLSEDAHVNKKMKVDSPKVKTEKIKQELPELEIKEEPDIKIEDKHKKKASDLKNGIKENMRKVIKKIVANETASPENKKVKKIVEEILSPETHRRTRKQEKVKPDIQQRVRSKSLSLDRFKSPEGKKFENLTSTTLGGPKKVVKKIETKEQIVETSPQISKRTRAKSQSREEVEIRIPELRNRLGKKMQSKAEINETITEQTQTCETLDEVIITPTQVRRTNDKKSESEKKKGVKKDSEDEMEDVPLSARKRSRKHSQKEDSTTQESSEEDVPLSACKTLTKKPQKETKAEDSRKSTVQGKQTPEMRKKFVKKEEFSEEALEARKKLRNFQVLEQRKDAEMKEAKRNSMDENAPQENEEKEQKLKKRPQMPGESDTDSKFSDNSSVPASLESQAALFRRNNIFRGISREKICQVCEETGEVFKCKGPCNGVYHFKCAMNHVYDKEAESLEATKEQEEAESPAKLQSNVEIVSVGSSKPIPTLSTSPDYKDMSLAEKIDLRMKEIMRKFDYQAVYSDAVDSSTEEIIHEEPVEKPKNQSKLSLTVTNKPSKKEVPIIKHVTADNVSYICVTNEKPKEKDLRDIVKEGLKNMKCYWCTTEETPRCLVCNKEESRAGSKFRQKCSLFQCGKYYHPECLKTWPQTQWSLIQSTKDKKSDAKYDTFVCPRHVCHTCISDDPRAANSRCPSDKVVKCLRCPATYHSSSYCVPAGTHILSSSQIVCPRHYNKSVRRNMQQTINTNWCFICSKGGNLICCETCPTSVHAECLPGDLNEDDTFFCEDCQSGRLPLYDEIVWVKLGTFRWWPALILFPNEVPDNVRNIAHNKGEFVVKFFGTYDHYWVGRGRTFLFQEGDKGHSHSVRKKVDSAFVKAIEEAAAAHQLKKQFKLNKVAEKSTGLKPPPYIRIKVNKPVGNVRLFDGNTSNTTSCDCDPNQPHPCGPDSDCLNRLLLTECNPEVCPAGERCNNQCFEKREYPPLVPHRTHARGWGLKTLAPIRKGQFVIEYVGEIIDEQEYQRRIQKMHEQKEENYYFLTIDKDRTLDAGPKGNVARFMNHSCQPNCETQKWTVNGDTRVGLFAKSDIPADTELTFNYNLECIGKEKKICKCGAPNCSGFIGVKVKPDGLQKKPRKKKTPPPPPPEVIDNENPCFICGNVGDVGACNNKICTKYYHLACVGLTAWPEGNKWTCHWHTCNVCSKRTIRCCVKCINSYCPPHSEGYVRYDKLLGFVCFEHDPTKEANLLQAVEAPKNDASVSTEEGAVSSTTPEETTKTVETDAKSDDEDLDDISLSMRLNGVVTSTPMKKPQDSSQDEGAASKKKSKKKKTKKKSAVKVEIKSHVKNTANLFNSMQNEVKLSNFTPEKYLRTSRSSKVLNRTDPDKDLPIRKRNRLRCGNTL